jgi:sec-independent protein translocase protein TatB
MFEVGFTELLVIFVLALVVLGPEKLPRLAAQVGRWIGRARAMAKQFRDQLEDEVNIADMNKWQKDQQKKQEETKPADPPTPEQTASAENASTQDASAASTSAESSASGGMSSTESSANSAESHAMAGSGDAAVTTDTPGSHPAGDPPAYTTNSLGGTEHAYAGPAPEPEPDASIYTAPAYATNGNGTSSSTTPSHAVDSPAHPAPEYDTGDDKPARPGDVITTTHERGP